MKKLIVVFTIMLCLLTSAVFSQQQQTIYEDETYSIYYRGNKVWLEIGDLCSTHDHIVYTPNEDESWRKTVTTKNGIYDEDINFKKLPFPFGLLLHSDMIYINKIIYCSECKASITFFSGPPTMFLIALLTKVKNV